MQHKAEKIGLVLGSGGAKGIAHLSVLAHLEKAGIPITCIAGSSVGAIAGAAFAIGTHGKLLERVRGLKWTDLMRLVDQANPKRGLLEGKRVLKFLSEFIPQYAKIDDLKIPFAVVATDLYSGEPVVIRHGNVLEAIRASISIPGVFRPFEVGGRTLVDGGITDPLPVEAARGMGATAIVAVDLLHKVPDRRHREHQGAEKPPTVSETLLQTIDIMERMNTARIISNQHPDIRIRPEVSDIGILEFHRTAAALEAGDAAFRAAEKDLMSRFAGIEVGA